jgi:hypothetical protein
MATPRTSTRSNRSISAWGTEGNRGRVRRKRDVGPTASGRFTSHEQRLELGKAAVHVGEAAHALKPPAGPHGEDQEQHRRNHDVAQCGEDVRAVERVVRTRGLPRAIVACDGPPSIGPTAMLQAVNVPASPTTQAKNPPARPPPTAPARASRPSMFWPRWHLCRCRPAGPTTARPRRVQ